MSPITNKDSKKRRKENMSRYEDFRGLDEFAVDNESVVESVGVNEGANASTGAARTNAPSGVAGPVVIRPIHGGIKYGRPWTGGSRDPAKRSGYPLTEMCYRTASINPKVFTRCEKGVGPNWEIKLDSKVPLSSCQPRIMEGLMALGVDSVFWMQIKGKLR